MCKLQHINGEFYLKYTGVISQLQIPCSGTVDAFTVLLKAGTVTGTVPGVFLGIPFQRAAQMGQRLVVGVSRLTMASQPLVISWGRNMEREGENTFAKGCSFS